MTVSSFCSKCEKYKYANHQCPPQWDVWCERDGEKRGDHSPVYADDAQDAAEVFAECSDRDSAEYSFMKYSGEVMVAPLDNSAEPLRFAVEGEAVPTYHALEIEP
jgi:hypothetical protein